MFNSEAATIICSYSSLRFVSMHAQLIASIFAQINIVCKEFKKIYNIHHFSHFRDSSPSSTVIKVYFKNLNLWTNQVYDFEK